MNKILSAVIVAVAGLAALALGGPALVGIAHALVPLVLACGITASVLRAVWWYTRR